MSINPQLKIGQRRDNGQGDYLPTEKSVSNSPTPSKPFKDLMDQGADSGDFKQRKTSLEDEYAAYIEEGTQSIFDMASPSAKAKAAMQTPPAAPFDLGEQEVADASNSPPPSPATLYQNISKNDSQTALHRHTSNEVSNLEGKIASTKDTKINPFDVDKDQLAVPTDRQENPLKPALKEKNSKDGFNSQFGTKEQPDLSSVNPLSAPTPNEIAAANATAERTPMAPALTTQQVVEQIMNHMEAQEFKADGLTNTTVTLNYPPIFDKAQVVVTSYDTARHEFNITFQNLGPQAKALMDQQSSQDSLKHALQTKGYMVHIITATTQIEKPIITDVGNQYRGGREQQGQQQQGRQQHQQDQDEEQQG